MSSKIMRLILLVTVKPDLDKTVRDSDVSIQGYNIYRNDRDSNGGGVAIYVKESLPEPKVKIISNKLEPIELEFNTIHAKPFLIISWYRPPIQELMKSPPNT